MTSCGGEGAAGGPGGRRWAAFTAWRWMAMEMDVDAAMKLFYGDGDASLRQAGVQHTRPSTSRVHVSLHACMCVCV